MSEIVDMIYSAFLINVLISPLLGADKRHHYCPWF
jgi:hypothetical protein